MASGHGSSHAPAAPSKHDPKLFIDPIIGSPLHFHVHEDVKDRDAITEAIAARGGNTTSNYSTATYILVDPKEDSGQALWRLYASNKKKVILDARWVWACIRQNSILSLGHSNDWGGFKVNGREQCGISVDGPGATPPIAALNLEEGARHAQIALTPPSTPQPQTLSPSQESQNPFVLDHNSGSFLLPPDMDYALLSQFFAPNTFPNLHGPLAAENHIDFGHGHEFGANLEYVPPWDEHGRSFNTSMNINDTHLFSFPAQEPFAQYYFGSQFPTSQPETSASSAPLELDTAPILPQSGPPELARPLKRKNIATEQSETSSTPEAGALPQERRSPTPPTRAISSTHGGNVFTDEDVAYLHKYIAYCKDIGSVLRQAVYYQSWGHIAQWSRSLREICERLAVKAPHHTFFSWRRYCNKHKIQLGGYSTNGGLPTNGPRADDLNVSVDGVYDEDTSTLGANTPASTITLATEAEEGVSEHGDAAAQSSVILIMGTGGRLRYRRSKTQGITEESHYKEDFYQDKEPEAPKSLYRSKSGKGIAFTRADVDFLVRFISFRRHQGLSAASEAGKNKDDISMARLWTDIVEKAPHHSRASWVKFWRRHKHELESSQDSLLPASLVSEASGHEDSDVSHGGSITTPRKRQRYSRADDILIACYLAGRPLSTASTSRAKGKSPEERETTSQDAVFREFALAHPQHPWKGWLEHYRTRKVEIEHLVAKIGRGEEIE